MSYAKPGDPYYGGINKDKNQKATLGYGNTSVSEIAGDLIGINSTRIINKRKNLDSIFLKLDVRSDDNHLLAGKLNQYVLEYLKLTFDFSVKSVQRKVNGYILTGDRALLNEYAKLTTGVGSLKRDNDSIFLYRVTLNQIAGYFESKRKKYIKPVKPVKEETHTFTVKEYSSFDKQVTELKKYGLFFHKKHDQY